MLIAYLLKHLQKCRCFSYAQTRQSNNAVRSNPPTIRARAKMAAFLMQQTKGADAMAHIHCVYDNDTYFKIDAATKTIKNEGSTLVLVQGNHNSERFTFEMPRYIDGHDMSLCNRTEIHYLNINGLTGEKNPGLYEVEDLQISPNSEDVVICSWLISGNATQYVGNLNFMLSFKCVSDTGSVDYVWNTAINSSVLVVEAIINTDTIAFEYADVLAQWKAEIDEAFNSNSGGAIESVNGQTGEVVLTAEDVGALPEDTEIPEVPDKVSAFENDIGYLTEHQSLEEYAKKTDLPTKVSELENDENYLKEHQDLSEYAKTSEVAEQLDNKADLVEGKIPVEQIPDNVGGVQPDWNETDTSSKAYIKNKPFEDTAKVIKWDGNTSGLETLTIQNVTMGQSITLYKVSNETFSREDLVGGTITIGGYVETLGDNVMVIAYTDFITSHPTSLSLIRYIIILNDCQLSSPNPGFKATYATKGVYFLEGVTEIRPAKGTIKQIDEKFIPDTIARKSDIEALDIAIASAIGSGVLE